MADDGTGFRGTAATSDHDNRTDALRLHAVLRKPHRVNVRRGLLRAHGVRRAAYVIPDGCCNDASSYGRGRWPPTQISRLGWVSAAERCGSARACR